MQKQKPSIKHELRGMLADMSVSSSHPETLNTPSKDVTRRRKLMHGVHKVINITGNIANKNYVRKTPDWAEGANAFSVLGYGSEKIAYKLELPDAEDKVVSVYHYDSIRTPTTEIIAAKERNYEIYRQHFGNLVLQTEFASVDNPWGAGEKPATIQPFIEQALLLGDYSDEEIRQLQATDQEFAADLANLASGYTSMLASGVCPDFATSNVLRTGSHITILDTGRVFPLSKLEELKHLYPNYRLIESLAA